MKKVIYGGKIDVMTKIFYFEFIFDILRQVIRLKIIWNEVFQCISEEKSIAAKKAAPYVLIKEKYRAMQNTFCYKIDLL